MCLDLTLKIWSLVNQGFFLATDSVLHFWSYFSSWCCSPPFLEVVHSWAHCAWVSTWQCVYAVALVGPMYAWRRNACLYLWCSAWCLWYLSHLENHSSRVACDGEGTSCFTWFVLGKVGYFAHNMLGKGWYYPCIVSTEDALRFNSKGLGHSLCSHSKVISYHWVW